ncbi:MAG: SusC/RagA family TonB-linked outer membrane protein, partial [Bacteroidales bacterium]|nr:SusC/RagA family TonB-linked outer membrane protein [Bacteroidales bacterium]
NPNAMADSGYPNYVAYPNIDWQDVMYRNEMSQEHNVSVSGSTGKSNYMVSANYLDNPGLMENTGAKRYSMRTNLNIQVTDWLKVGTQTYGYVMDKKPAGFDTPVSYMALSTPGQYPRYKGEYGFPAANEESATANNPLYVINGGSGYQRTSRIKSAVYAQINFLNDFSFKSLVNYSRYWYDAQSKPETPLRTRTNFATGQLVTPASKTSDLSTSFTANGQWDYTVQETLNWNHTFGLHDVSALAGYEEFYNYTYNQSATKKGLIDPTIWTADTATEMQSIGGNASDYSSRSWFGRVNYAYNSRYLFEANIRYDGSSRFSTDKRWGVFPSFSAGWRASEESFIKDLNVFDNLKARASWGKLGNNSIGNYDYQSTYAAANYSFNNALVSGLAATAFANNLLEWETTTVTDFGIDLGVLENRLTAEIDYYHKKTDGILYRPTVYLTSGTRTAPYQNIAEVTNQGLELTLGWRDRVNDFTYSVSANFAANKNRVSKYKGELKEGWIVNEMGEKEFQSNIGDVSTGGSTRVLEGHLMNEYYMLQPYSGNQKYFNTDGSVNPNGGPTDGMIRTEKDMDWLRAMVDAGYSFYPNQSISKDKIWYGDMIYADVNGDGVYGNTYDNQFQGKSSTPKYTFGLQGNVSWKGFDFSMNWAGAAGFDLYWRSTGLNSTGTRIGYNMLQSLADDHYFYDPENPSDKRTNINSSTPRLTCNEGNNQQGATSTLWLYKGDYIKLKNVTIGYTLPTKWTSKVFMKGARIFFSAENLFTITSYPGQDPEMGAGMGYVTMRQCAFGANISF